MVRMSPNGPWTRSRQFGFFAHRKSPTAESIKEQAYQLLHHLTLQDQRVLKKVLAGQRNVRSMLRRGNSPAAVSP